MDRPSDAHEVTGNPQDLGRFKAPSPLNVAVTVPYIYEGSIPTLETVLAHYNVGGRTIHTGSHAHVGWMNPIPHGPTLLKSLELTMIARSSLRTAVVSLLARRAVRALVMASVAIGSVAATASAGAAMRDDVLRHLRLLRASPAADATLATSPDAIRLWLSEPAEAPASKIALATAAGAAVALQPITREAAKDAPLVAKVAAPLAAGAYKVTWKAMSKDGHVVNGTYGFTVGAAK